MSRVVLGLMLALAALLGPFAADAEQPEKVFRIGLLANTLPTDPSARAFVQGLRALGYVEGQNLILERRSAEGRYERFGDIVAELVRLKADVIVTGGYAAVQAAKVVTTTVPIVMAAGGDPVDGACQQE